MFLESLKMTITGVGEIFLLGALGYILQKKNVLSVEGLNVLTRIIIEIMLPAWIVSALLKDFSFSIYPDWWLFPLISIIITFCGMVMALPFLGVLKGIELKKQFLSLMTFQNSGYLPLALAAALLPKAKADVMFIYLFLFLLGFNLIIWSLGVYLLTFTRAKRFELGSLFSPPVLATLLSLLLVGAGLSKIVPEIILKPLTMVGQCSIPLALLVVGGNIAQIRLGRIDKKVLVFLTVSKMILLPLLGLWLITKLRLPELLGLLIIMQLAMPPATSLSVIIRHYKKEDLLISQGIFFGHVAGLITIPLFLSLYFIFSMVK